jgi:peptidyl-prolyl cis-trans isomerase SurA
MKCKQIGINVARTFSVVSLMVFLLFGIQQSVVFAFSDRVLVVVNDDVVTQSEFSYRYRLVTKDYDANPDVNPPADLRERLLDTLVSEKLQIQEALQRKLSVSDAEVEVGIERYAAQQGMSVAQLRESLAREGQAFESFVKALRDNILIARLNEYYAQVRVSVPDYEIDGFLARTNWGSDQTEYLIAHILLPAEDGNAELAQQIVDQLRGGASFQQAVLTYSTATNASDGGLIGWRRKEQLPTVFAEALDDLSLGGISDVIQGPNGFHILKLQDQRGEATEIVQSKVQHILIKADTQIARKRATLQIQDLRERILNGEDFAALARIFSDDTVSASLGGDLGWVSSGQMVKPFEAAFKSLEIGELSQAVETRFGIHLLRVNARQTKNVTEQLARSRAESILRRQRAEREYSQWVRSLRDKAYIQEVNKPA